MRASDSGLLTYSYSSTASIVYISPFFYTFSNSFINPFGASISAQTGTLINGSVKIIKPYIGSGQSILSNYNGSGYIYFLIPQTGYGNPLLSLIKDPNGYIIHDSSDLSNSSFTYSNTFTPTGIDGGVNYNSYRLYRTTATCSYIGVGNFEFIF